MAAQMKQRIPLLLILAVAGLLLFVQLDDMYLWHDEAQTATIAVNTLRWGYPRVWDGVNLLTHLEGNDFNDRFVHISSPWLQFYVCAGSLWLLGHTTLAARLPFTLAGLATVFAVWQLARRVFRFESLANAAAAILAVSVPFLLYSRQSRYYSLVMLFTVTATYSYFGLWQKGERTRLEQSGLALSLILLFYSNHLAYGVWLIAAALHLAVTGRVQVLRRAVAPVMASLVVGVPWLLYAAMGVPTGIAGDMGLRLLVLAWKVQVYFIPFLTLGLLVLAFRILARGRGKVRRLFTSRTVFFPLLIVAYIVVISVPDFYLLNHYLVGIVPIVPLILVQLAVRINRISRAAAAAVIALCITTNVFHVAPYLLWNSVGQTPASAPARPEQQVWVPPGGGPPVIGLVASPDTRADLLIQPLPDYLAGVRVTSHLLQYFRELTSSYFAPNKAVVDILRERARPGDTVLVRGIEYEHIVFYTGLRVVNRLSPLAMADAWSRFYDDFPNLKYEYLTAVRDDEIDWVVLHTVGRPLILQDPEYLQDNSDRFEVIPTGAVDLFLSNSPDLDYHKFVTVEDGPEVLLLRRKRGDR